MTVMLITELSRQMQLRRLFRANRDLALPGSYDSLHWNGKLRSAEVLIQDILDHPRRPIA